MLTHWTIGNFKSIRDEVTLELAPLTIFSGINSSGKSSLIQSILMVAQSFASVVDDEALVLNGRFLQLGRLQDVTHYEYERTPIKLGFVWRPADALLTDDSLQISLRAEVMRAERAQQGQRIRVYARLNHSTLEFARAHAGRSKRASLHPLRTQYTAPPGIDPTDLSANLSRQIAEGVFNYYVTEIPPDELVPDPRVERAERVAPINLVPSRLLVRVDAERRNLINDVEWLVAQLARDEQDIDREGLNHSLSPLIKGVFDLLDLRQMGDMQSRTAALLDLKHDVIARPPPTRGHLLGLMAKRRLHFWQRAQLGPALAAALVQYLARSRPFDSKQAVVYEERLLPVAYMNPIDQIRRAMNERVFFLGPLREEPRVIYGAPPLSEQWSVGQKGEYTAAMLDDLRDYEIRYPVPPGDTFRGEFNIRKGRLIDALTLWLRRMSLVDTVDTEEAPKVGYRLTVHSPNLKMPLDLTSVGVGVSQVLPTLVQALLAPDDSILIFEQPELHLHPKVESVLGDFFLGIAALGKQCLVETHSEHLINRMRRRIAEAPGDEILSQVRIFFTEKDGTTTRFREVKPNEYGSILDWPEGFFDQSEMEASLILQAQLAKRLQPSSARKGGV